MLFRDLQARIAWALVTAFILDMPRNMRRVGPARFSTEAEIAVVPSTTVNVGELTIHVLSCKLYVSFTSAMK